MQTFFYIVKIHDAVISRINWLKILRKFKKKHVQ